MFIVGLSSVYDNHQTSNDLPIGIALVLLAQSIVGLQYITEEKIMSNFKVSPVKAVGLEGIFGFFAFNQGLF